MSKPHILVLVIWWNGSHTVTSARFETGFAAQAAGQAVQADLTSPTCNVYFSIHPEKI